MTDKRRPEVRERAAITVRNLADAWEHIDEAGKLIGRIPQVVPGGFWDNELRGMILGSKRIIANALREEKKLIKKDEGP